MPFTLEQRYKVLNHLNLSLLRSHSLRANYEDYGGEFWHMNAKLNPTEYQMNRPRPLKFEKEDFWQRLDAIELESEYLVQEVVKRVEALDRVEAVLDETRSSPNYAITVVDVVEYNQLQKTKGLETQRDQLIEELRHFLDLPPSALFTGGGSIARS